MLRSLGIPEAKLQGSLRNFPGVHWWSLGSATKINQKNGQRFLGDEKSFATKSGQICPNVPKNLCFQDLMPTPRRYGVSCAVDVIHFRGHDLGGALHPEIAELTQLEVLDLVDTNVSGSLEVLANHTRLRNLQLRHTRVTGRLEDLPLKAKGLWRLDLTGTEVTGDVAALADATKLEYLRLSNTAVSGELKSLAKLEKLAALELSNTAVSGELKSLEKLTELKKLDLSNTAACGELKSLAEMKYLKQLDLANLKAIGDASVMAEWSYLEHVDISGTEVEFVKADFLQKFEPYNKMDDKWQCPLPSALRFLDVSRTSRFSLAQDLLRPFAGCGKLARLKAAGCGLTGPLWPEIVDEWGYTIPMNEWPLSQALSVLDFARNNVTDVAKLPGSCRKLVLTGNPGVSFGAGVVEKAIKDIVFIDLRNATFANLSDALLLIGQLAVISLVTHAVISYAESTNRTHSSQNFQISSERMICKFVKREDFG